MTAEKLREGAFPGWEECPHCQSERSLYVELRRLSQASEWELQAWRHECRNCGRAWGEHAADEPYEFPD